MKHCIPDELFNGIEYPETGHEATGIDAIYRSVAYKFPKVDEVIARREIWHSLCDLCARLGVLQERIEASGETVEIAPRYGRMLWITGASAGGTQTANISVAGVSESGNLLVRFAEGATNTAVTVAVAPEFGDETIDGAGAWKPQVPRYVVERYGEAIAHGAMARLYAMRGDGAMARMHATAYNNDLNRLAFGRITGGMRKHLLIDIEDWLINTSS